MREDTQMGNINLIILSVLVAGILIAVILVQNRTNLLPKASDQTPLSVVSAPLESYPSKYITSAQKNIITLVPESEGKRCIIPSGAYRNGIYIRDAFYSVIAMEDLVLSENCFRKFEESVYEDGQVRFAVYSGYGENEPLYAERKYDESNLLYIIWAGILKRNGYLVDEEKVKRAYAFVAKFVEDGWFKLPAGNYRYWADTYINLEGDTITYNQGLYALSLLFLSEIFRDQPIVPENTLVIAVNNYVSLFGASGPKLLPLSRNTTYQDASSLLPELLRRIYFSNGGALSNEQVLRSVDGLVSRASVYDSAGRLQGIKIIFAPNGSFLSPSIFSFSNELNNQGDYQNGAYWPMYTLGDLALAYKLSNDDKYKNVAQKLMEKELDSDGKSKEFLSLRPGRLGAYDSFRSDYSWNALIALALKWSGMVQ